MTDWLRLQMAMVAATIVLFVATFAVNEWLFSHLEYVPGIAWVFLPAGIRLLSTLLFKEAGALGLLIVSCALGFLHFFPDDPVRACAGGIMAALAPYGVYRYARQRYGLHTSLASLTPQRLLLLIVLYSAASPLLHHLWFFLRGEGQGVRDLFVMFTGDLLGTLLVIYAMKFALWLAPRPHR